MSLTLVPEGPGTTIELRDGAQGLPVAPRGTVAILGRFPSGPVSHAALASTPATARLISGTPDDGLEASLSLSDVYVFSSPIVLLGRVTDGNEVKSSVDLWDRNPARSIFHRTAQPDRSPLAVATAQNGGAWGGRRKIFLGSGTITSLISGVSQFTTGVAMLENELADASLYIESDDSGTSYTVVSNTTAGVLSIKEEFSSTARTLSGSKKFQLVLSGGKELSVVIGQDGQLGQTFNLKADRKFEYDGQWETVSNYTNLGLSNDDSKPWISTIYDAEVTGGRYQIEINSEYSGSTVEAKLPANYCEVPTAVTDSSLLFQWYRWSAVSDNTGNPFLNSISPVNADSIEPHVYTLTFTAATTANVSVQFPDGSEFALGTLTLGTEFNPAHPQLSKITMKAGSTGAVSGDSVTIRVNTLPLDLHLRDAYIYPVAVGADGNASVRLRISSSTYRSVSVRSDLNLADYGCVAMSAPSVIGTADLTAVSLTSGTTVILSADGLTAVTLTVGGGGIGPGAAAIAAGLTALDTAGIFSFTASGVYLKIALARSLGNDASLLIGAGTGNTDLGLTGGNEYTGVAGVPARIEARLPMWGGYDGANPSATRYELALGVSDHIFKQHSCLNLGLVRMITPGVSSGAVKTAADTLVSANGWMYIAEFDSSLYSGSTPGEAAVSDMIANESRSDYVEHYFPSHGRFYNTEKTKLVTRSISGAIAGLRAKLATTGVDGERGMHIAAANDNVQGRLSPLVRGLPDALGRWSPPIQLLDNNGIVPVRWEGPNVFLYGNRMYSQGRTQQGGSYTITERAVYYHVARDLFVTTRPFVFKSLSSKRLSEITRSLRDKLKQYHQDGWFSDHNGSSFDDQVIVTVPLELNPPENLQEGRVSATVEFRPRPALEDLRIIISPTKLSAE